jgi:hypothetical protein
VNILMEMAKPSELDAAAITIRGIGLEIDQSTTVFVSSLESFSRGEPGVVSSSTPPCFRRLVLAKA